MFEYTLIVWYEGNNVRAKGNTWILDFWQLPHLSNPAFGLRYLILYTKTWNI
jgi:hypothetical protein